MIPAVQRSTKKYKEDCNEAKIGLLRNVFRLEENNNKIEQCQHYRNKLENCINDKSIKRKDNYPSFIVNGFTTLK